MVKNLENICRVAKQNFDLDTRSISLEKILAEIKSARFDADDLGESRLVTQLRNVEPKIISRISKVKQDQKKVSNKLKTMLDKIDPDDPDYSTAILDIDVLCDQFEWWFD